MVQLITFNSYSYYLKKNIILIRQHKQQQRYNICAICETQQQQQKRFID